MEKQINTMPDIKIFVVCHKPSYVPKNPYLYPIQVGTALAECFMMMKVIIFLIKIKHIVN